MSYKALNQAQSVFYLSMFFSELLFIRAPVLCIVSFCWYVLCLLVVLAKFSVLTKWLANWLERKTPLRKPNLGNRIISTKPRPKTVYDFCGLLYRFLVQLYVLSPVIHFTLLWHDIACLCQPTNLAYCNSGTDMTSSPRQEHVSYYMTISVNTPVTVAGITSVVS